MKRLFVLIIAVSFLGCVEKLPISERIPTPAPYYTHLFLLPIRSYGVGTPTPEPVTIPPTPTPAPGDIPLDLYIYGILIVAIILIAIAAYKLRAKPASKSLPPKCPTCGTKTLEGDTFCRECGGKL